MKVCTCFLLFTIFALTKSTAQKNQPENPRSVALALETVLEFNNKNKESDLKFLDDVHEFISKVKTAIVSKKSRRDFPAARPVTFTGFIQELVNILNTYEDGAFEDFFSYLDDEIRKYHYRGCKFYELTENYEMRKLLATKLNMIKGKPVIIMRAYINLLADMIRDEEYGPNLKELVKYINSLYRQDAEEKFHKILSELEYYGQSKSRRTNNNLVKIIRDGVRSVLFDYYSNLNPNARRELKNNIDVFWKKQFKEPPTSSSGRLNDIPYTENKIKTSNNNLDENENPIALTVKSFPLTTPKKVQNIMETTKKYDNINVSENEIEKYEYQNNAIIPDSKNDERQGYKQTRTDFFNKRYQGYDTTAAKYDEQKAMRTRKQSKEFSSDELKTDSFESNSIEFSQELQREYNTKPYQTLYPEEIHNKHTTKTKKVSKKHVHRSHRQTTVEAKYKLHKHGDDKGKIKHKHHSKHKTSHKTKHGSKHDAKHDNKHDTRHGKDHKTAHHKDHRLEHHKKHDSKHKIKHYKHDKYSDSDLSMPEHGNGKLFHQYKVLSTNIELYEYKKNFGPVRPDLIPNVSAFNLTTKESSPTKFTTPIPSKRLYVPTRPVSLVPPGLRENIVTQKTPSSSKVSSSRWLAAAAKDEYQKPSKLTTEKSNRKKQSKEHSLWSDEGMSIEQSDTDKNIWRDDTATKTTARIKKGKNVFKRINELEKELKDVKSQLKDIKDSAFSARKHAVKLDKKAYLKGKENDSFSELTSIAMPRKSFNIKTENVNLMGAVDKKFVYKYVKEDYASNITDNIITKKSKITGNDKTTIITQTNFIYKVSSGTKVTKGIQFMIEDQDYVNPKDPRIKNDYDGVDEWKALKFARIEAKTKATKSTKNTSKSTAKLTATSKITMKQNTTLTTTAKTASVSVSKSAKPVQRASESTTVYSNTNTHNTTSQLTSDVSKSSNYTTKVISETRNSNVSAVNAVNSTKSAAVIDKNKKS